MAAGGEAASARSTRAAVPPRTSSRMGRPCLRWPWNFMPSLAIDPPAMTATRSKTPLLTRAAGHHQGGDGGGAEVLDVGPDGLEQPALLGHRLGHVAAAPLVAVADGLLAAAEDVVDRQGVDVGLVEQVEQGQGGGGLGRQVVEQDHRRQRLVDALAPAHDGPEVVEGADAGGAVLGRHRLQRRPRALSSRSRSRRLARGWPARAVGRPLGHRRGEGEQAEVVDDRPSARGTRPRA